jgi:hypothetical protein
MRLKPTDPIRDRARSIKVAPSFKGGASACPHLVRNLSARDAESSREFVHSASRHTPPRGGGARRKRRSSNSPFPSQQIKAEIVGPAAQSRVATGDDARVLSSEPLAQQIQRQEPPLLDCRAQSCPRIATFEDAGCKSPTGFSGAIVTEADCSSTRLGSGNSAHEEAGELVSFHSVPSAAAFPRVTYLLRMSEPRRNGPLAFWGGLSPEQCRAPDNSRPALGRAGRASPWRRDS